MLEWLRTAAKQVDEADRDLARCSAQLPASAADPALKGASTAANRSALWLAAAAVLASRKGPTRRGACRGLAAIAGASATTNLLAKSLFPRRRPAAELVPEHRRLSAHPRSSSFPSGHAASAAAFAAATAMESPAAGLAVAPLAAGVAYSRVHTGVHWPSDVVCGAAIGAGMAYATTRWWPLPQEEPAAAPVSTSTQSLVRGEGMVVLVNPESGNADPDVPAWVRRHWPAAEVVVPEPGFDLVPQLESAVDRHPRPVTALGVAGGDGSVAAIASLATRRGLPLAVLASGTLNHFAKDVGVDNPATTVEGARRGTVVAVDLSGVTVDGDPARCFLNTASLGGYPDMVRFREKWQKRWGKWPAAAAALARVLYASRPLEIDLDGERVKVWLLFVGNGSYRPKGFAPTRRPRLDNGLLDVRYARADVSFSRVRFVLAAATGALHRSRTYVQADRPRLDVHVHGAPVAIATDGEIRPGGNRFTFAAHDKALHLYRPAGSTAAELSRRAG
ncbi:bifunctional phosphatase PAP2/diacylglycerol kinase family protein [Allosaccharopolyspora coralli]|uniref:bifunctional phosphatase PAP2/diacylglycerol kinase family protein n=1 Tax=Allosaccharopolyspora coralli TaxID=2665642 RepID=UPI001E417505|nr:bifunctional phosphatase PAP2/diacylglycerol kinase family protein [Allosaccharopolyspora coralli]